jgi:hypothetical protein
MLRIDKEITCSYMEMATVYWISIIILLLIEGERRGELDA